MVENKKREEIEEKDKWDLTKIFSSQKEYDDLYKETKELIDKITKYQNHVMDDAKTLYEVILKDMEINRNIEKLYVYASMKSDEDVSNNKNQELVGKALNLYDYANKMMYFINPELLKEDYSKVEKFYKEEPKLLEHEQNLKDLFRYKEHILSDEEEKLLSSLGKCFGQSNKIYELMLDSDMKFGTIIDEDGKEQELTDTNYSVFIKSKDRNVRKQAFDQLYKTYQQFQNTLSKILEGHIKENVTTSHIKKYDSAFLRSLFSDELPTTLYEILKETVHENLDIYQKYFKMKKEVLGLEEMHLYDVYVDLIDKYDKKYSFAEAKEILFKSLSPLGEDYKKDALKAFDERWIDIYPNKNKRGGAYSGGCYDTNPYMLLNYQGEIHDVSTIIHELGHSMHSYYSRKNQPYQYGDYPIFVAEVASTTNELILSRYLIDNSKDDHEKLAALNNLLELFKGTIYRQVMFEEFEQYAYDIIENDDVITADKLCDKFYELNKEYFGDAVICDEGIRYEWEKVSHFYYNFYVYKYATSLSAACDIATRILDKEEGALESYLEMLKSGSSKNALDTLLIAGVDMTDKKVYQNAINMFDDAIEEFKKTYKKIK